MAGSCIWDGTLAGRNSDQAGALRSGRFWRLRGGCEMDRRKFLGNSALVGAVAVSSSRLEGSGLGPTGYTDISDELRLPFVPGRYFAVRLRSVWGTGIFGDRRVSECSRCFQLYYESGRVPCGSGL